VREDDKPKAAWDCLSSIHTMPFGLKGAPATFQRLVTAVLGDLNWQIVLIYLDDIIVYSRSFEEHLEHLEMVWILSRQVCVRSSGSEVSGSFGRK
jgi:hypothetical protein